MTHRGAVPARLPVLTAAEMRDWDAHATGTLGIPEKLLMESAGRAAAAVVHELHPRGSVAAAVGKGNNGGDALVMLRTLQTWGREVMAVPQEESAGRSALLHGWEVPVAAAEDAEEVFGGAAVLVDGLLGTGAVGAPRGGAVPLIRAINGAGRPVVALDGPSGVDLTSGAAAAEVVDADTTISFGALKRGHLLHPGRAHTGRLVVVEVGFPPFPEHGDSAVLVTSAWARHFLPSVPWNAHKGTTGRVAVVAGRSGMSGAAVLVCMGALRAGAGLVTAISSAANREIVQSSVPEALFVAREDPDVADTLARADAIVIGPGMGVHDESRKLLAQALSGSEVTIVLDADALTLISRNPDLLGSDERRRVVMTPHPLELARLLGVETEEVLGDPFEAVERAVDRFSCAVLLKGAPALVGQPGERTLVNTTGHSGVATGGTGDTLSGIIGALAAAGATPFHAAALALYHAGRAAELAGRGRGLLPRDIAEALPDAFAEPPRATALRTAGVLLDLPPPR